MPVNNRQGSAPPDRPGGDSTAYHAPLRAFGALDRPHPNRLIALRGSSPVQGPSVQIGRYVVRRMQAIEDYPHNAAIGMQTALPAGRAWPYRVTGG